jgi:hypothetical protein
MIFTQRFFYYYSKITAILTSKPTSTLTFLADAVVSRRMSLSIKLSVDELNFKALTGTAIFN